MNYLWDFGQSKTEKYFKWIIKHNYGHMSACNKWMRNGAAESRQRDFHLSSSATKCFPTVHYKSRYLIAMIQYTIQNINVFASFTNHMYACGHTRLYSWQGTNQCHACICLVHCNFLIKTRSMSKLRLKNVVVMYI